MLRGGEGERDRDEEMLENARRALNLPRLRRSGPSRRRSVDFYLISVSN